MTNTMLERTVTTMLRSRELSCPSCVPRIEKALGALPGVIRARVHFNSGRIEVEHEPTRPAPEELIAAVARAGYQAEVAAF
jgi:copper chaperone CopZ